MWQLQPPWKKSPPLSQQPPLKVEVLSSPSFLKIWLEAQPPQPHPPLPCRKGGAHYEHPLSLLFIKFNNFSPEQKNETDNVVNFNCYDID